MEDTVLRSITTGVYVVTAQSKGEMNGCTVSWASPVSYDPLLVMIALGKMRVSHDQVQESGYFGLNVLADDQVELGRHFGFNTARDVNKLEGKDFSTSENGLPILGGVCAYLECRVVDAYPAGEHTLFIGEVISAPVNDESKKPLVFKREDYF